MRYPSRRLVRPREQERSVHYLLHGPIRFLATGCSFRRRNGNPQISGLTVNRGRQQRLTQIPSGVWCPADPRLASAAEDRNFGCSVRRALVTDRRRVGCVVAERTQRRRILIRRRRKGGGRIARNVCFAGARQMFGAWPDVDPLIRTATARRSRRVSPFGQTPDPATIYIRAPALGDAHGSARDRRSFNTFQDAGSIPRRSIDPVGVANRCRSPRCDRSGRNDGRQ